MPREKSTTIFLNKNLTEARARELVEELGFLGIVDLLVVLSHSIDGEIKVPEPAHPRPDQEAAEDEAYRCAEGGMIVRGVHIPFAIVFLSEYNTRQALRRGLGVYPLTPGPRRAISTEG